MILKILKELRPMRSVHELDIQLRGRVLHNAYRPASIRRVAMLIKAMNTSRG
jgi:hypothetical protein